MLTRKLLADPKQKRRFEREARAAARLHHTNIVPVFGFGEADGVPFYVMRASSWTTWSSPSPWMNCIDPAAKTLTAGVAPPEPGRDLTAAAVVRSLVTGDSCRPTQTRPASRTPPAR